MSWWEKAGIRVARHFLVTRDICLVAYQLFSGAWWSGIIKISKIFVSGSNPGAPAFTRHGFMRRRVLVRRFLSIRRTWAAEKPANQLGIEIVAIEV